MFQQSDPASPTSVALLMPLLHALAAEDRSVSRTVGALPSPCAWIDDLRTAVCATKIIEPPIFQAAMVTAAWQKNIDVVLLRHGLFPEILDPIAVDVVLGADGPAQIFWDYVPFRATGGGYWLVPAPDHKSRCLRLDRNGIIPAVRPPFGDSCERADGIARAARETILALRRLRGQ